MQLQPDWTNADDAAPVLKVSAAASVVGQALEDLLQHVHQHTARGEPIGRYDQATDTIMTVTESIFSSMGDAGESRRDVLRTLIISAYVGSHQWGELFINSWSVLYDVLKDCLDNSLNKVWISVYLYTSALGISAPFNDHMAFQKSLKSDAFFFFFFETVAVFACRWFLSDGSTDLT